MHGMERAVTDEQKEIRKKEIRDVFESQFSKTPLGEITLATIAKELGRTRSHVYKYYSTVMEIAADVWAEKFSDLCRDFIDRTENFNPVNAGSYAELAYSLYFIKSDVMKYISMQTMMVSHPEAARIMKKIKPLFSRWMGEHLEVLKNRFGITPYQAQTIYVICYYNALGIYNTESVDLVLSPNISSQNYGEYIHSRYVRIVSKEIQNLLDDPDAYNTEI